MSSSLRKGNRKNTKLLRAQGNYSEFRNSGENMDVEYPIYPKENNQRSLTANASRDAPMGACKLTAMGVLGRTATIIRSIFALGLGISAIITLLIAIGVFVQALVSTRLLYVCFVIEVGSVVLILFDTATAKWIVEKLIIQLTTDLKIFADQLEESGKQIERRDEQLVTAGKQLDIFNKQLAQNQEQLKKQDQALEKTMLIQTNMRTLLNSLMNANAEGENLNNLFARNLEKFERLLNHMSSTSFTEIDGNHDGLIDPNEFKIYTSRSPGTREIKL